MPPAWNGATTGIGLAKDNGTGGSVTVEFDTAKDAINGTNLKYNIYYAPSASWNGANWDANQVVANAAVHTGSTFSHAVTVSGLSNNTRYTFGVRAEDQSGNEDANTATMKATPTLNQPKGTYSLMLSYAANRSGAVYLDDASVEGNIYVFVAPTTGIKQVKFYIDGQLQQSDTTAPYDLEGSNGSAANPFNSSNLSNGYHSFSARITKTDGSSNTIKAEAYVNASSAATVTNSQGNLALNHSAVASSVQNSSLGAAKAVDGAATTRWSSRFSNTQWIYVDLGAVKTVSGVELDWETAYGARYEIQVSNNAVNWSTVYTETNGHGGKDKITFSPTAARYVRMYGLKRGTPYGYSLYEFKVYGASATQSAATSTSSGDLTSANITAMASSVQNSSLGAANAVDGVATTRWSSAFSDSQWIYVDLGAVQTVSGVELDWETAYGARYEIQVSNNAVNWSTVYTEKNGNGGKDEISFSPTVARYVRMYGLKRGTKWGYSLYEFKVYGGASAPQSVTTSTPTPSADLDPANITAMASSVQNASLGAANAVDGIASTRWSSAFSNTQWIYVDLGAVQTVSGVELDWETAYGAQYEIQVSNDAVSWSTVYTETNGRGGVEEITFSPTAARYVRMYGLKRGTPYGYSLYAFKVY